MSQLLVQLLVDCFDHQSHCGSLLMTTFYSYGEFILFHWHYFWALLTECPDLSFPEGVLLRTVTILHRGQVKGVILNALRHALLHLSTLFVHDLLSGSLLRLTMGVLQLTGSAGLQLGLFTAARIFAVVAWNTDNTAILRQQDLDKWKSHPMKPSQHVPGVTSTASLAVGHHGIPTWCSVLTAL